MFFISALRVAFYRLRYGSRFKVNLVQRISPSACLELYGTGKVIMGRNVCVRPSCEFQVIGNGCLHIGSKVFFNRGCMISCHENVEIGDGCIFGPDVKIYDNDHCFSKDGLDLANHKRGLITIGEGTWIAANVVILRDTHIGKHCVVGAGAVVKGVIPDHSLVTTDRKLIVSPIE